MYHCIDSDSKGRDLDMMNCPKCGHAAHTRSSFQVTESTKERYCQCQNINCGSTFVTHETVVRFIVTPALIATAPPHPLPGGQGHMNFEKENLLRQVFIHLGSHPFQENV